MRQVQLPIVSVVRKFLSIRCSHGYVYRRICSHCHRVQPNEKTRSLCGSTCRKRKGTQLVQNALRWPAASNSTNKAPIPTQLKKLVRKYPQWEEELPPLFKATEIVLNVSRCELCTSSCTKSKPPTNGCFHSNCMPFLLSKVEASKQPWTTILRVLCFLCLR